MDSLRKAGKRVEGLVSDMYMLKNNRLIYNMGGSELVESSIH